MSREKLRVYRKCAWCGERVYATKQLTITAHMRRGSLPARACPGGERPVIDHFLRLAEKQKTLEAREEVLQALKEQLTPEQLAILPEFLATLEKPK